MHTPDVGAAARALGGDVVGRDQVLCPGPGHSPRDRSLAVRFVADGFIVHSHANDDWQTCRDHVSARLGLDSQRPVAKPARVRATPQSPDDTVDRIGWARSLWRATIPARGTLAERYLVETRRLELPDSAAIRFHPRLKFSCTGEFLPTMLCAMVDIRTNEFTGIHRTFLTNDAKKAGVLTLGRKLGSAIKIDPDDVVHEGLAVAEGVESAIAARFIYRPVWSLIDANGINGFPVLPGIEHLSIFADNAHGLLKGIERQSRKPFLASSRSELSSLAALAALAERGRTLRWISPSGVLVSNIYNKPDPRVRGYYLGAKRVRHIGAYAFLPELDIDRCVRGAAPNLVHSLDASHLAFVALGCERERDGIPLLTVHDSYAVLGCHVDRMREIWLCELRAMYESVDMLRQVYDYSEHYSTPPPIPPPHGLKLKDVNGLYALA